MSQSAMFATLQEAIAVHRQGSPVRAIPVYERALQERPDYPEALVGYGLALAEAGRSAEAEGPIRRAIAKDPTRPNYRLALVELHFRIGDAEAGVAELKAIVAAHPKFAPAFARLGRAYVERQELSEAAEALDTALQLAPGDHATALLLARALAAMKNYGAAYHVLDHAEIIRPNDIETLKFRLEIARTRRDFAALESIAQRLSNLAPEDSTGWRDLAAAYFEGGRYADALAACERVLTIGPKTAENLSQYASVAINALEYEKAQGALDEAERLSPNNPRMLATKALLLTYQGKKEEAEAYCLKCIDADPDHIGVYQQLSVLRNGRLSEAEERTVERWAGRDDVATSSRANAAFVFAHSLEARGEIDRAFAEYERANALAAERNRNDQIHYDFAGHAAWTDAIINVFRRAPDAADAPADDGPQPIFIVGLPRCGSTLVESVIAAHSQVEPGGEMPMMPNIFNRWLHANYRAGEVALLAAEREALALAYRRDAPTAFSKARFTDKNLLNLEAAGLIAEIFPKAVVVNVRRNPVENGVSIWRQDMLKFWAYATSFEDIARRYGLYARLVDHFERIYPSRFHTIQYEDFATDFRDEARRLIALCGLPWEDACGDFQNARAIAPTMSAMQVRGEVRLKSDRAALYGARLDPLRAALEAAGVDLRTGALRKD